MTGLDPLKDVIVEVATIVTDDELNIIEEGPDLVIYREASELSEMDKIVVDMHTSSGLLKAIDASDVSANDARDQTLAFLTKHIDKERTVPLCGNSIGTDRRFLAQHWPEIENFLHYRSVDVSTIKELGKRWYQREINNAPDKGSAHRALDDIRESIDELKYYRANLFK